ncbi:MAG TPA: hypothetical protein VFB07_03660 [Vicinamibacterales bacterium]|nr:hypothetical protein [Vicinamibacterales bacterium]
MRSAAALLFASTLAAGVATAQEPKPVPKDSARVSVPGCSKGYIFTVAARSVNEAGTNVDIPEGTHLRMNGPKRLINEIKAHEGQMIQLTGLMKVDQLPTGGVNLGGGVRVGAGAAVGGMPMPGGGQNFVDVEGYRPIPDRSCPSR